MIIMKRQYQLLRPMTRSFSRRLQVPILSITDDDDYTDDDDDEPQNPLLQSVVINVLMNHVPKCQWKTCRLVCKTWHDELLPRWSKHMDVRIGGLGKSDMRTYRDNKFFITAPAVLRTYQSQNIRQLEKFPFRSIKTIAGKVTVGGTQKEIQVQNSFWNLCGAWLHRLHFHGVVFQDLEMLKQLIFRLTPNLQQLEFSGCDVPKTLRTTESEKNDPAVVSRYRPGRQDVQLNLKKFTISQLVRTKTRCYDGKFPLSLLSVFSVFINIEEVALCDFMEVDLRDEFIKYFLDVISTIRVANQNSALNIKILDIKHLYLDFTPELVTQLCSLSLPLDELHIQIDGMENTLQQLLRKYSALKNLTLLNSNIKPLNETTFQFDSLPQTLTELGLHGCVFEDCAFLAFVPNLVKLKVHCEFIPLPKKFHGDKIPLLEFLTEFQYDDDDVPHKTVRMLTKIMPNITKLKLSVNCAGFKTVCTAWPQLIYWKIPYAQMKETTFIANVKKLSGLTCLQVNTAEERNNGHEIMETFGNKSIKKGFLMIPKLQRLCITFPHGITEKLLKDLYEKVEDTKKVFVVRNNDQRKKDPLINIANDGHEKSTKIRGCCCCHWC